MWSLDLYQTETKPNMLMIIDIVDTIKERLSKEAQYNQEHMPPVFLLNPKQKKEVLDYLDIYNSNE